MSNLINEKLKQELIDVYSNNNTVSEKNIILKKLFQEIEKEINKPEEEKKMDFEVEKLSK